MPHIQKDRSMLLLDIVDQLLRDLQEPIHYRTLCDVLIKSRLWENPWGKEPDQILYSALHNDVKHAGATAGRFMFMGGGIFCTTFVEGVEFIEKDLPEVRDNAASRDPYRRSGDMPGDADKRRARAEAANADKRCGSCTFLQWEGPNLHTHEAGSCTRYAESRRSCVLKKTEACKLWKLRTPQQANEDRETPPRLRLEAALILTKPPARRMSA